MPEREAMVHLGHKSAAIHRAYAKKAKNVTLPLEFYEAQQQNKIVKFYQDDSAKHCLSGGDALPRRVRQKLANKSS